MKDFENLLYLSALHSIGMTHSQMKKSFLEGSAGLDYKDFFQHLDRKGLMHIGAKDETKISDILQKRDTLDLTKQKNLIEKCQIEIISWENEFYPERLKQIGHAPYLLYVRGRLDTSIPLIGIVGSRKNSSYGKHALEKIVPELIGHGYGTVSGGAHGIDTLAHTITLQHHGYTVSVLASGIDRSYPAVNVGLYTDIIGNGGAVLSHFPLGSKPELYNFPIRNEIVAALSLGVFIPEAALNSGTLITAQLALEHGRDLFVLPGDIDRETSAGTNRLIATGQAKCIMSAEGILEEYEVIQASSGKNPEHVFDDVLQEELYMTVKSGPKTLEEISLSSPHDLMVIMEKIAILEIMGLITLDSMSGQYRINYS